MKTPRNEQIISTVTTAERDAIDAYADAHGLSRAEVIRRGTLAYITVYEVVPKAEPSRLETEQEKIRAMSEELRRLRRSRP